MWPFMTDDSSTWVAHDPDSNQIKAITNLILDLIRFLDTDWCNQEIDSIRLDSESNQFEKWKIRFFFQFRFSRRGPV